MSAVIRAGDDGAVDRAVAELDSGAVLVLPTDTVYGVAAALSRPGAVGRIFEIKKRPREKPLPVLVSGLPQAQSLGEFREEALELAQKSWPGAVTVVVPSLYNLSVLGGDGTSVGLRVPAHPYVLEILSRAGPLAATSANVSGSPTSASIEEISSELGDAVDLYVDDGVLESRPSEVISLIGPPKKLR